MRPSSRRGGNVEEVSRKGAVGQQSGGDLFPTVRPRRPTASPAPASSSGGMRHFSSSERATVRCLTARSYSSARKSSMATSLSVSTAAYGTCQGSVVDMSTSFSVSTAALMVDSGKRSIFSASSACEPEGGRTGGDRRETGGDRR